MFKNPHSLLHDAEAQKLCNHLDDYLEPEFASASDFYQNPLTNYLDTLCHSRQFGCGRSELQLSSAHNEISPFLPYRDPECAHLGTNSSTV